MIQIWNTKKAYSCWHPCQRIEHRQLNLKHLKYLQYLQITKLHHFEIEKHSEPALISCKLRSIEPSSDALHTVHRESTHNYRSRLRAWIGHRPTRFRGRANLNNPISWHTWVDYFDEFEKNKQKRMKRNKKETKPTKIIFVAISLFVNQNNKKLYNYTEN